MASIKKFFSLLSRQRKKIRVKLFISYFLIILLSIVVLGSFSFFFTRRSMENNAKNSSLQITSLIKKNLEMNFEQIRNLMLLPFYNKQFILGINEYTSMNEMEKLLFYQNIKDFFSRSFFVPTRSDFEGLYIFLKNGKLLYSSRPTDIRNRNDLLKEKNLVIPEDLRSGKVFFSGAYLDSKSIQEHYVFAASIKIADLADYSHYTTVIAEFDFKIIADICDNSELIEQGIIMLLDDNGKIVYSTGNEKPGTPFPPDTFKSMTGEIGTLWASIDGNKYLTTYNRSSLSGWNSVALIPGEFIFNTSERIKLLTIITAAVGLFITGILSLLVSGMITRPLIELKKSTENLHVGERKEKIEVHSSDEIGNIAESINTMIYETNDLLRNSYLNQIKLKESELNLLYSKINPHFLYNTLDSIRAMAVVHKADNVASMVNALGNMFRYSIAGTSGMVEVREEIEHVKNYLFIQHMRFGEKILYSISIDPSIMQCKILRLILQPLIENAIHHGLEKKKGIGHLKLRGFQKNNQLVFTVSDDGIGISPEKLRELRNSLSSFADSPEHELKTQNIGLTNVHARLVLQFDREYGIEVSSNGTSGTQVTLVHPIQFN